MVFMRVSWRQTGVRGMDLAGRDGLAMRYVRVRLAGLAGSRHAPGRLAGQAFTLPDELAAVRADEDSSAIRAVPRASFSGRDRRRVSQCLPDAVGWAGNEHGDSRYRGTARRLSTRAGSGPGWAAPRRRVYELPAEV